MRLSLARELGVYLSAHALKNGSRGSAVDELLAATADGYNLLLEFFMRASGWRFLHAPNLFKLPSDNPK